MRKYILITILILLIPIAVYSRMTVVTVGGGTQAAADPCAETLCAGCIAQERFECGSENWTVGTNNDEENAEQSDIGTYDPDYTGEALEGSQTFQVAASTTGNVSFDVTSTGFGYISFIFRGKGDTVAQEEIMILSTTGASQIKIKWTAASNIFVQGLDDGFQDNSTATYIDTLVYIKIHWKTDTGGNNGNLKWWTSTDGKVSNWDFEDGIADGTGALDGEINRITFGSTGGNTDKVILFDDIRMDDEDINY